MSDDQKDSGGAQSDQEWRSAKTFSQGEPYGAQARGADAGASSAGADRRPGGARMPLSPLLGAGAAMLATTFLLGLIGVNSMIAFVAGLAVFAGILIYTRKGAAAAAGPRTVAPKPGVDAKRVQGDLDKAEAELSAMDVAAPKFERPTVAAAIGRFTAASRAVLDEIARDPNDAERARKFLVVILPSARRSVEKFLETGVRDGELDGRFEALLGELETAATKQLETLRLDEKLDLEVEMEVLADRLRAGA